MSEPARKLSPAPAPAAPAGPVRRVLKKGEHLFKEGEMSRSMYLLKRGMVRIYKKKGDAFIEIDTIRSGQILGELAFLDGNPRSASGEAMMECELLEISGPTFTAVLGSLPEWLKIMLKTIVSRLRTAGTRIRQLEAATVSVDYQAEARGEKSLQYAFLSPQDLLKLSTAVLLVASRAPEQSQPGIELAMPQLERYAFNVMQVPLSKLAAFLDLLTECALVEKVSGPDGDAFRLLGGATIEKFIQYLAEENTVEPSKRHDLTKRGWNVMSLIANHISEAQKDEKTGLSRINLATIYTSEKMSQGREPFMMDDQAELHKLGYTGPIKLQSATEIFVEFDKDKFIRHYRFQRIVMGALEINEQKRASR